MLLRNYRIMRKAILAHLLIIHALRCFPFRAGIDHFEYMCLHINIVDCTACLRYAVHRKLVNLNFIHKIRLFLRLPDSASCL